MDDLINKKKEAVYDEFLAKCCHVFDPEKSNRATYVTDLYVAFTEWRKVENKENPKITPGQFKKYMAQRFPLAGGVNKYFKGVLLKGRCLK